MNKNIGLVFPKNTFCDCLNIILGPWMKVKCEFSGTNVQSMDWLLLVPAINTSEMTPNEFKMTLRPCEKHFVHLRTHLWSYWDSFWVLMRVSLAGIIPGTISQATISARHKYIWNDPKWVQNDSYTLWKAFGTPKDTFVKLLG